MTASGTVRGGNWYDSNPTITVSCVDCVDTPTQPTFTIIGNYGGTAAIHLAGSGSLVIATGTSLTVRGDVSYNQASTINNAVYMQPGSSLMFDSSNASLPNSTRYVYGGTTNAQYRRFYAPCTAEQMCTVTSHTDGTPGIFSARGFNYNFSIVASYVNFSHLGDDVAHGFYFSMTSSGGGNIWSVTNSTFDHVAQIESAISPAVSNTFIHNYNTHTNTRQMTFGRVLHVNTTAALTAGTKEIIGNYFDVIS